MRNSFTKEKEPIIEFGPVSIDLASRIVRLNNEILKLTTTEYNLLSIFIKNEGRVLTHQYLLKQVWGNSYADQTQYLRVFVAQLRKKIEEDPNRPKFIITESGGINKRIVYLNKRSSFAEFLAESFDEKSNEFERTNLYSIG